MADIQAMLKGHYGYSFGFLNVIFARQGIQLHRSLSPDGETRSIDPSFYGVGCPDGQKFDQLREE